MKPTYREKNLLDYLFGGFRSTLKPWPSRPKGVRLALRASWETKLAANSGGWFGLQARLCSCHVEHHSNHDANAWASTTPTRGTSSLLSMINDEEPAPSAALSENEDDEACSDAEQASRTRKRCKTGLTKCEDEYAVSQRRQALSAKTNTGKFLGLRVEKPAKADAAKTTKHSGKDFVYGVLFVEVKSWIIYFATPIIIESTVFWRKFSVKRVFPKMEWHWETQKKIWEKRVGKWFKWYNQMAQMAQVGTSGTSGTGRSGSPELRGTSETRTRGSSDSVEQVEQGQWVCPAEPLHLTQCGTTRPCNLECSLIFILRNLILRTTSFSTCFITQSSKGYS